jgi:uncharacterized protein (UPF0303 family)
MSAEDDIDRIRRQEAELVFDRFDEAVAFDLGSAVRARALAGALPVVVDIRTFDRPLFYAAMPGSNASNPDWARRKINVVRRFLRSSYRMVLEQQRPDRTFKPGEGLDIADYVLAGGGFPIAVRHAGIVGAIAVSGLPERDDHALVVEVLAGYLGADGQALALPAAGD